MIMKLVMIQAYVLVVVFLVLFIDQIIKNKGSSISFVMELETNKLIST